MGTFTFSLAGGGGAVDQSLYQRTPDDQLTYTGDDYIVWDRVNNERIRRGLPGLDSLGFPRPPEESDAADGTEGKSFTVKGPPGLTRDQAFEIFQQQQKAGSLVGLKPGAAISSLTQAADGVPGALAQLGQGLSLPGIGAQLPSGLASVGARVSSLTQGLPVTDGINVADFAKQIPSVKGIGNLDATQVRAAIGQAAKLVDQGSDVLSDAKGLGQYGLDTTQLERAGYVKPGTAATYLQQGANSVTSVLQSPAVWTGKNGVSGAADLLASAPKQALIQQDLMSQGLSSLKEFGVPVNSLSASSLSGTLLNAAKSPSDALAWAQGLPLPGSVKGAFDTVARDSSFAVNLADTKLNAAMIQQIPGLPAIDTVDRATLNAAATRVAGNDKIPPLNFSISSLPTPTELTDQLNDLYSAFQAAREDAGFLEQRIARIISGFDTRPENRAELYDAVEQGETLLGLLDNIKDRILSLKRKAEARDPPDTGTISSIENLRVDQTIKVLEAALERARQRLDGALRA